MAKFWHIIIALIASLILSCIFHWIGWDWTRWPIGILFAIYFVAILFSHQKNPFRFHGKLTIATTPIGCTVGQDRKRDLRGNTLLVGRGCRNFLTLKTLSLPSGERSGRR
jgi:hypothetical protein